MLRSVMKKTPTSPKILFFLIPLLVGINTLGQKEEPWKEWLREVDPIMTNAERSVFHSLKTEEDRMRFIESFWKTRDPNPQTSQNEYKLEYYRRISYAKKNLGGIRSDRGRIYLILGEPTDKRTFTGSEQVVDAELWTYYGEGRPGLPPVMNLIFFRRGNAGDFRLFYPGVDTALDVISPAYTDNVDNAVVAYDEIRKSDLELADATLSVIPGEGVPGAPATATSSNHVFAQIYSLPEKEISSSYLRGFRSIEGTVDVTYSTQEMPGYVLTALSRNRGYTFLNYSIAPEVIHLARIADNRNAAELHLNLKIEGLGGKTICQQEKNIEFRLDDKEKKALQERKIMFSGFLPVIPGTFNIKIVLSNRTTKEFLIDEESFEISDNTVLFLYGYGTKEIRSDRFMPFSTEKHKLSIDPRSIFNKTDSIEGAIFIDKKPSIYLTAVEDERDSLEVTDIVKADSYFLFKQPLANLKPANYYLIVKLNDREVCKKIVAVLPYLVARPEAYEWTDPPSSGPAYDFEIATQYLNRGEIQAALERFNTLPEAFWNSRTKPIIARAYYQDKNFEKVVELLEGKDVIKDYSVLYLLGNSSLELKKLKKAAEYFEQLRAYGDTAKINQVLGAIFLSLGEREKAKVYFDRAKDLENKPPAKGEKDNKEPSHENN
jgi:GWxTD domain-containing protein